MKNYGPSFVRDYKYCQMKSTKIDTAFQNTPLPKYEPPVLNLFQKQSKEGFTTMLDDN